MITTAQGNFSFKGITPGNYVINLTMVGMDDIRKIIEVRDTTTVLDLGTLKMTETSVTLDDAVVTAVSRIPLNSMRVRSRHRQTLLWRIF